MAGIIRIIRIMRRKTPGKVAATEAAKTFGALVDRVRESGAIYQIESRGQVVAEITPPRKRLTLRDFQTWLTRGPRAPGDLLDAIEQARDESRRAKPTPAQALSGRGGRRTR